MTNDCLRNCQFWEAGTCVDLSLIPTGWRLGSLNDLGNGSWRAGLIDDEGFVYTAIADDPNAAITGARESISKSRLFNWSLRATEDAKNMTTLFGLLGLAKEKEVRRA